jgi:hypothetical protein
MHRHAFAGERRRNEESGSGNAVSAEQEVSDTCLVVFGREQSLVIASGTYVRTKSRTFSLLARLTI